MTIREEDRFIAQSKLLDKYGSHVQIAKSWLKGELTKDEELVAVQLINQVVLDVAMYQLDQGLD